MKVGQEVWVKGEIKDIDTEGRSNTYDVIFLGGQKIQTFDSNIQPYSGHEVFEAIKKIELNVDDGGFSYEQLQDMFTTGNPKKILKNNSLKEIMGKVAEYEDKNMIKVGDIVITVGNIKGVVTKSSVNNDYNECYVLFDDGSTGKWDKSDLIKTGKHIDIESILKEV